VDFNTSWQLKSTKTTFVRRRRWVREMEYDDPNEDEPQTPTDLTVPPAISTALATAAPIATYHKPESPFKDSAFYGALMNPLKKMGVEITKMTHWVPGSKKEDPDALSSKDPQTAYVAFFFSFFFFFLPFLFH